MFVTLTLNPAIDHSITVHGELAVGAIHAVTAETCTPGGKGVNVAKMLASNGARVTAAGLLGSDRLAFYEATLRPAGIACRFLPLPHATRVNLMITNGAGQEMKFNRPGFPDAAFDERALLAYAGPLADPGAIVILSGSLPARFPADTYARLIRLFHKSGSPTVLDTSGPALAAGLREKPTVIKPNRRELEGVLGQSLASEAAMVAALRALSQVHEAVIVSDGARGAWFAGRGQCWFAVAPDVSAVDTTGAGDALLGQFCADYFLRRLITPDVMARAVAAGAAAVEQRGTPAIAHQRVVELAGRVRIRDTGKEGAS
jgi:1-phosphofructokinase